MPTHLGDLSAYTTQVVIEVFLYSEFKLSDSTSNFCQIHKKKKKITPVLENQKEAWRFQI